MVISRNTSVSLDLLRGCAALMVFLHHCDLMNLSGDALAWFRRDIGHSAVVIFFVLSGYVISATLRPNGTAIDYGIKRASRIYSVAVPAVLLTWLIDLASIHWRVPLIEGAYQVAKPWIYVPMAMTFSGDFWVLGEPAFSDVPYWSLNYEVWYYIVFGVAVFARGTARWVGLIAVLALMGPKLWLLLPIWLGGVAVCRMQRSRVPPRALARAMVALSIILFLALKTFSLEEPINTWAQNLVFANGSFPLRFSQWFAGDFVIGILTMALVYGLGGAEFDIPPVLRRPITALAGVSFSLYLVHYPLLSYFGGMLPGRGWIAICLALACAMAFGAIFEPKKDQLRRLLTVALARRTA